MSPVGTRRGGRSEQGSEAVRGALWLGCCLGPLGLAFGLGPEVVAHNCSVALGSPGWCGHSLTSLLGVVSWFM